MVLYSIFLNFNRYVDDSKARFVVPQLITRSKILVDCSPLFSYPHTLKKHIIKFINGEHSYLLSKCELRKTWLESRTVNESLFKVKLESYSKEWDYVCFLHYFVSVACVWRNSSKLHLTFLLECHLHVAR